MYVRILTTFNFFLFLIYDKLILGEVMERENIINEIINLDIDAIEKIKRIKRELKGKDDKDYEELLIYLYNESKKINSFENSAYYLIIDTLLDDDRNYLFLKEIIKNNENFINARYKGHHIIFEILDRYIKSLKLTLLNQKIIRENPNYFYALLKLFRNNLLSLTEGEEEYFKLRISELQNEVKNKKTLNQEFTQEKLTKLIKITKK